MPDTTSRANRLAAITRHTIAQHWPDQPMDVAVDTHGSGRNDAASVHVRWTDGPDSRDVLAIVGGHVVLHRERSYGSRTQDILDELAGIWTLHRAAPAVSRRAACIADIVAACWGQTYTDVPAATFPRINTLQLIDAAADQPDDIIEVWSRLCTGDDDPARASHDRLHALLAVAADLCADGT